MQRRLGFDFFIQDFCFSFADLFSSLSCHGVVPMQMRFYPGVRFLIEWTFVPNCIGVVPMQTRFHPGVQLLGLLSSLSRKRAAS